MKRFASSGRRSISLMRMSVEFPFSISSKTRISSGYQTSAPLRRRVDLPPARLVDGPHEAAGERELLALQDVPRGLVHPEPDHRERDVHARLRREQDLVDGVHPELLVRLPPRVVLLDEPRLVEVAAPRVGAADPLALGPPLPAAGGRLVQPEVLLDAEVPLPGLRLRLREEEHLLVVLRRAGRRGARRRRRSCRAPSAPCSRAPSSRPGCAGGRRPRGRPSRAPGRRARRRGPGRGARRARAAARRMAFTRRGAWP